MREACPAHARPPGYTSSGSTYSVTGTVLHSVGSGSIRSTVIPLNDTTLDEIRKAAAHLGLPDLLDK